ncbi:MAG: hypothetical protein R6V51_02855, partial [Dehalococcoidia bacterium]
MKTRIRDIGKLNYLVDRKTTDPNWEGYGNQTHTDARKAVYKEILEGFRSLEEAAEYIRGQPEDNVIFTARGDEILFSMINVVIDHIKKNKWYSPWGKTAFTDSVKSVPMASKKPRTVFYVTFWKPKSDPEISQPYHWSGPEEQGAYASLDAALRAVTEAENYDPQAFDFHVYSRQERYEPDEEWPDLYGYWEMIDGTEKSYDRQG